VPAGRVCQLAEQLALDCQVLKHRLDDGIGFGKSRGRLVRASGSSPASSLSAAYLAAPTDWAEEAVSLSARRDPAHAWANVRSQRW